MGVQMPSAFVLEKIRDVLMRAARNKRESGRFSQMREYVQGARNINHAIVERNRRKETDDDN